MIVFDLKCARDHVFEAWFRDGAAYDAQSAAGEVVCPACGDRHVAKAPMAPKVARGGGDEGGEASASALASDRSPTETPSPVAQAMRELRAFREHVEKTFDNVGDRFPEEARKIHYGEAERRGIYGEATVDEARALKDEEIPFGLLPRPPRHDA